MEGSVSTSFGKSCSLAKADREDEKKMLPCRFFMSGYCHKGPRCRFYHPSQALASVAIKVPALPIHWTIRNNMVHSGIQPQMNHAYQTIVMPKKSHFHLPHQRPIGGQQPSDEMMMPFGFGDPNQNQPGPAHFHDYDVPCGNHQAPPRPSFGPRNNGTTAWTPPVLRPPVQHHSTMFNHIDWNEFLAPGQQPPPIIDVDREKGAKNYGGGEPGASAKPDEVQASNSNEDMPPEGTPQRRRQGALVDAVEVDAKKKLSAKEEFQRKVKEIALEERHITSGELGDRDVHMLSQ